MAQPSLLQATHLAAGARMGEADGWLQPLDYGDPAGEYAALHNGAGLVDLSARGKLRLGGADRARFLHNLLSNDILALRPGEGCHAAKLSLQGKMEAGLRVLCLPNEIRCDLEPGQATGVYASLSKHLVREKVQLEEVSARWALLALQGLRAGAVLHAAGVETASLGAPLRHTDATLAGMAVLVVRADHCGADGFDVWVRAEDAALAWAMLCSAGARPVGWQMLDVRRIEAGIPRATTEITGETFPMEAGLDAGWISYKKGCYLGQETISRIHHLGHVNRRLCGLLFEDDRLPTSGARLFAADKQVGWVTSTAWSPARGHAVGLAYVHREYALPGSALTVDTPAGLGTATVAALPLAAATRARPNPE